MHFTDVRHPAGQPSLRDFEQHDRLRLVDFQEHGRERYRSHALARVNAPEMALRASDRALGAVRSELLYQLVVDAENQECRRPLADEKAHVLVAHHLHRG